MIHDALCPSLLGKGLPDKFGMMERASCRCDLLARVRADERKRATFIAQHTIEDNFARDDAIAWINGTTPDWWEREQP